MNTKQSGLKRPVPVIVPMIGAFVLLAGCATEPSSRRVSAPPPPAPGTATAGATVVVPSNQQVATTQPTVIVQQAPPALQTESPPSRPSAQYVWVAGYWAWQNQQYVWVPGQWVLPPSAGANWVPPRWVREGNGYRFYDGYWD